MTYKSDGKIDTSKLGTHVGDRLFLDASLTDSERDKLFVQTQHITDKKLKIVEDGCTGEGKNKKCTSYEVVFDKDENDNFKKRENSYGNQEYGNQEKEAICNINGNSECVNGNRLISDLINDKRKVSITTQRDPNNWFKAKMDRDGKQQEKGSMATYNYPKNINDEKEYFALLNTEKKVRLNNVQLDSNGNATKIYSEIAPTYIVLAHELIHVHHFLNEDKISSNNIKTAPILNNYRVSTSYIKFKGRDYTDIWLDKDGIEISELKNGKEDMAVYGNIEEYRTVGTGFKDKPTSETKFGLTGDFQEEGDITENMIRQEHNLDFRATYMNIMFNNLSEEELKRDDERIKKILKEMEKRK